MYNILNKLICYPFNYLNQQLNLDTGKSRRIHDSDNQSHNGARTDIKTAQIFKDKIYGMNIPRI